MGLYLAKQLRLYQLYNVKREIERKQLEMNQQMTDLMNYNSAISDGFIAPDEFVSLCSNPLLATRAAGFAVNFSQSLNPAVMQPYIQKASMTAMYQAGALGQVFKNNPQYAQSQMPQFDTNYCLSNAVEMVKNIMIKQEGQLMSKLQSKMDQEKIALETQAKRVDEEINSLKEAIDKNAQDSVVKYS
ncbi:MAG: hypothetical protein ACI4CY_07665 [Candidatus Gastranaerophilaceae bacterium]